MDFNPHAANLGKFPIELPPNIQAQLQNLQNFPGLPSQALLNPNFLSQLQNASQSLPGVAQNKPQLQKPESQLPSTTAPKPIISTQSAGQPPQSTSAIVQNNTQMGEQTNGQSLSQPGQPSKADLAAMKEKIQKLMRMENLADITLAGYMIKLMRHRTKMSLKELHDEVSKCYDTLRRSDGSKYTGDLAKALKGCLTSSEIFREVSENVWVIREKEAKMYEEKTTKKLKTLINKKKGKSGRKKEGEKAGANQDADDDSGDDDSDDGSEASEEMEKAKPAKKLKTTPTAIGTTVNTAVVSTGEKGEFQKMVEVLEQSCKRLKENEITKNLIQNSLDIIEEGEPVEGILQKLGRDRLVGILECFEYFYPLIQDQLKINPTAKPNRPNLNLVKNVKVEAGMPVVKQEYTAPKNPKTK